MKINNFKYEDKANKWKLDKIEFNSLTLLVGASGAGKTLTLNALYSLKEIVNGESLSGICWKAGFNTTNGNEYIWEGEFENKGTIDHIIDEELKAKYRPRILNEQLSMNDKLIIKRNNKETIFKGEKTLKLSQQQSIIHILKEENIIKPVFDDFNKLNINWRKRNNDKSFFFQLYQIQDLSKSLNSLEKIRESDLNFLAKLYLVKKYDSRVFNLINEKFSSIFPFVEDIKIEPVETIDRAASKIMEDIPVLQIKEKNVEKWLESFVISSGMMKTLVHIVEIYLCPDGTVFLIDEFENSLGVNCIDDLTDEILHSGRQLQFILTSHHPYIINNIPPSKWKLVTRKGGEIKAEDADKYNIGKSKHDAYMQLLQLEEYKTGIK